MKTQHSRWLLSATVSLILSSCGTPTFHRLYSGPERPANAVAQLVVDKSAPLFPMEVDGHPVPATFFKPGLVEVLAGRHRVLVGSNMNSIMMADWNAEPGCVYDIAMVPVGQYSRGGVNKVEPSFQIRRRKINRGLTPSTTL